MNDTEKFLKELTALSLKYNLWINGCGCCESPWAQRLDEEDQLPEYQASIWTDGQLESIHPKRKDGDESTIRVVS